MRGLGAPFWIRDSGPASVTAPLRADASIAALRVGSVSMSYPNASALPAFCGEMKTTLLCSAASLGGWTRKSAKPSARTRAASAARARGKHPGMAEGLQARHEARDREDVDIGIPLRAIDLRTSGEQPRDPAQRQFVGFEP